MDADLNSKTILFYDGDCALCSFWVQFCLERDRKKVLFFAPLQGECAKNLLPLELREQLESIVLWDQQTIHLKSKAILTALRIIKYSPDLLFVARIVPTSLLDKCYDFVARHRYRWFGKTNQCPIPGEDQKQQLLS